ncbi:MAG: cytochrome c biogenesis CcdA family protein [Chloroflexia bacterium]
MPINWGSADIFVALLAGMLSFISPCVLPLVPAYLGYMSGASVQKGSIMAPRRTVLLHAVAFVLGFTLIFVLIFGIGAELLQALFGMAYRTVIQWVGGILLIVFGLHFLGLFNLPWLDMTKKLDVRPSRQLGYFRSSLIGMGFAAGWTPCVGPFLGLLLGMSGSVAAVPLFVAYSLGLGIPFILVALSMGQLSLWLRKITRRSFDLRIAGHTLLRNLNTVSIISGVLMIFMGGLLISNRVTMLNQWIAPLLPTWLQGI